MFRTRGFSLLELCITLGLLSLWLTIGLPRWHAWQQRQQAMMWLEQVQQAIELARTRAVTYGQPVRICAGATAECAINWTQAPLSFLQADADSWRRWHVQPALQLPHQLFYPRKMIEFQADGNLMALQNGTFYLCLTQQAWHGRLVINQAGRSQLNVYAHACPVF